MSFCYFTLQMFVFFFLNLANSDYKKHESAIGHNWFSQIYFTVDTYILMYN